VRRSSVPPPSRRPRLLPAPDGTAFDTTLERPLVALAATPVRLARARAFVRADHPALAVVYRHAPAEGELWVEVPRGRALAALGRALDAREAAGLGEALAALHAAGGAHGAVDAGHVYVDEAGAARLAFPAHEVAGSRAGDEAALARLRGGPPRARAPR
jgi:serine/threonine-protein kinase